MPQEWYTAQDLWVGARLALHSRTFELTEADEYTLQYLENHGGAFPMADPARALAALRGAAGWGAAGALRAALEAAGAGSGGALGCAAFQAVLGAGGVELPQHQAITLFRYMRNKSTDLVHTDHVLAWLTSRDLGDAVRGN